MFLLMSPLRFCEIVLSLVPSDDHRKKDESKIPVFTFSLQIKNMHVQKQVKNTTCVNFLLR